MNMAVYTQCAQAFLYVHTYLVCWFFCPPSSSIIPPSGTQEMSASQILYDGSLKSGFGPFYDFSGDTNPLSLSNLTHAFMGRPLWFFFIFGHVLSFVSFVYITEGSKMLWPSWVSPDRLLWRTLWWGWGSMTAGQSTDLTTTKHPWGLLLPPPLQTHKLLNLYSAGCHILLYFAWQASLLAPSPPQTVNDYPDSWNNVTSPFVSLVSGIKTRSLWME